MSDNTRTPGALRSLHVIIGGLTVLSTFAVASLVSIYHYRIEQAKTYSDITQRQQLLLDKIANRCIVSLGIFDLDAITHTLLDAVQEPFASQIGFGVYDIADILQAGVPSKEFVDDLAQKAEKYQSWGRYHQYTQGKYNVISKPIELVRWDPLGRERTVYLGKVVGVYSARDVDAYLREILRSTVWILLLCSSIGFFLVYWVLNRVIVEPIQRLVGVTRLVSEKKFDIPHTEALVREIEILWKAFREMASEVGRFNSELEARVALRTEELERANDELRRAQDAALRAEKFAAIGRLASGVGHELRNPLAAIKNALYYIRDAVKESALVQSDPALSEFLDHADHEIRSATNIVGDLLDFARAVKLNLEPVDVNSLVEGLKRSIEVPENVSITEKCAGGLPEIQADPQRLRQACLNLATNAIQAMPSGGALEISTRMDGNGPRGPVILIAFKDSGVGISKENMTKIFEPLFTTKAKGTGLGLAIVQSIVEAHGGEIRTASEVGKGSTFMLRLPVSGPEHANKPKSAA